MFSSTLIRFALSFTFIYIFSFPHTGFISSERYIRELKGIFIDCSVRNVNSQMEPQSVQTTPPCANSGEQADDT